jgi:hypothetical protein
LCLICAEKHGGVHEWKSGAQSGRSEEIRTSEMVPLAESKLPEEWCDNKWFCNLQWVIVVLCVNRAIARQTRTPSSLPNVQAILFVLTANNRLSLQDQRVHWCHGI